MSEAENTQFPNIRSILKQKENKASKQTNKQTTKKNHGPIKQPQNSTVSIFVSLTCVQIRLGLVGYLPPLRSRQNKSECKFHNQNFKPDLW